MKHRNVIYISCSVCKRSKEKDWMVYVKPEQLEIDYFPEIGNLCIKCCWDELNKLVKVFKIPSHRVRDVKWMKKNISKLEGRDITQNKKVEEVIFFCGLIIDRK